MHVPDSFKNSYARFPLYPCNLVDTGYYHSTLETYREQLEDDTGGLFIGDSQVAHIDLPVWDAVLPGQITPATPPVQPGAPDVLDKWHICDDTGLKDFLSDESTLTAASPVYTGEVATRPDPKCRYIFPYPRHARAPLSMTRTMLGRLFSYYQIMPIYLDFLTTFGQGSRQRDLRYSGFRGRTRLSLPPRQDTVALDLGRSGRHIQMCYNLKSVACITPPKTTAKKDMQWSRRPVALYHHFDVVEGNALWVITSGGRYFRDRLEDTVGLPGRAEDRDYSTLEAAFRSTFVVHALAAHWAKEGWPAYIQWLEDVVEESTCDAIYGARGELIEKKYTPDNIQSVQYYEDRTNEATMILESNRDVLAALSKYYEDLLADTDFPLRQSCRDNIVDFARQLQDAVHDTHMQASRARLVVRIAADRKALVQSHLTSQATAFQHQASQKMEFMTSIAQRDAIMMRIITFITLVYLPATFVSTFFSTDVVKYQDQNDFGRSFYTSSYSKLALERWLQITLPLTTVTLTAAWWFFSREKKRLMLPS
ncbi:hypothetical protein PV04_01772 [Phialophora macrospora]|uniref:CorA-like transporter domain-containing protein n=1 Tax=Phialophora macrospora TaxID=1851006 RepID=A0A0D2GMR6_9EURO|nr:hypothetical protein PV04_01772 [Phialophora macrospora]